jgi:GH24 family phage-related lysozyme (muramidase)
MNISNVGIKLIQDFEGCVLFEYKDAIGVPTIGWGHTGGVQPNQRITQAQADDLLRSDLKRFVDAVNNTGLKLNQNQFDALCSFAYNCGQANLKTLVKDRSIAQIANALPMYCKASGRTLDGLVKRRNAEKALFLKPVPVVHPYPGHPVKKGSTNTIAIKLIQVKVGVTSDGVFGDKTLAAVKKFQKEHKLVPDGIIGKLTWRAMFG